MVLALGACSSAPEPRNEWPTDSAAAQTTLKQRAELYEELSRPNVDPYFGEQHALPACDESTVPAPKELKHASNFGRLYHFYSGAGGSLKTCDPEKGTKTQVLFLYCGEDKKLYEYRHQYDFKAPWKQEPAVTCRND